MVREMPRTSPPTLPVPVESGHFYGGEVAATGITLERLRADTENSHLAGAFQI